MLRLGYLSCRAHTLKLLLEDLPMLLTSSAHCQFGSELKKFFPEAILSTSEDFTLTSKKSMQSFVSEHGITAIINYAAYTAVDKARDDEQACLEVNTRESKLFAQISAKLIHISQIMSLMALITNPTPKICCHLSRRL